MLVFISIQPIFQANKNEVFTFRPRPK